MKFNEMRYVHKDFENIKEEYEQLINELKNCKDSKEFMEIFNKINDYRSDIYTMSSLCNIRHTIDTSDKYYDEENEYWDNTLPLIRNLDSKFEEVILNYPKREELDIDEIFFIQKEMDSKIFNEDIIEDLQEENKLASEYTKLKSSASFTFNNETHNLTSIEPYFESEDREVRKQANLAVSNWYQEHEDEFDDIYDRMVKVRTKIANKLGFKSFTEVGYLRMKRIGYGPEDVKKLRDQVINEVTPLVTKFKESQKERLGLDNLYFYDDSYKFKSGNPKPVGNRDVLVGIAKNMYEEMSLETGEFFNFMNDNELFDLESKPNKDTGGYCEIIPKYKSPFIFSNFNGTMGDVDVLTHECGHAFQGFMSLKGINNPDLLWPSNEAAEIHSMSMEFFAYPWMKDFFKDDVNKYKYAHTVGSIDFLPYGCLVDHFQHEMYDHPELSKEERKQVWRKLEKIYEPYIDFEDDKFLEKGTRWYRKLHIFTFPFYYIDYVIAGVCALNFRCRMLKEDPKAWSDYVDLCKLGGTKPFLDLVKVAGIKSPFEEGTLKETISYIKKDLDKIDETTF